MCVHKSFSKKASSNTGCRAKLADTGRECFAICLRTVLTKLPPKIAEVRLESHDMAQHLSQLQAFDLPVMLIRTPPCF